jgi:hypothetical protein
VHISPVDVAVSPSMVVTTHTVAFFESGSSCNFINALVMVEWTRNYNIFINSQAVIMF